MRAALLIGVAALALAAGSVRAASAQPEASAPGAHEIAALLRGIPQDGPWRGRAGAKVTLVEYVDVQCPYCSRFARETFPTIVRRYVRTGRVRILFRGLAFVGADSLTGLRWVVAAGRQDRLWHVLELLFANQGMENKGWVTASRLTSVARSVDGLRLDALRRDSTGAAVTAQIRAAAGAAQRARVPGTPYFEVGPSLRSLEPLRLTSFDPADFAIGLDKFLR
jgi:protein-disulfide isomerase